jgi:flagellar hook-associated protein FlgK
VIRPTFLAFETAKRAINVSRAGLDTVGHNISNTNTPGYTRQRADQVSLSMGAWGEQYQIYGTPVPGMGADIRAVNQIRDPYLDNRYRTEATNNGELGIKADGLTDINNIFDEIMTDGLHYKMGELINAIDIFATEADSKEVGMVVRNMADQLTKMLNKNAAQLEEARAQTLEDVKATVDEKVNTLLDRIAILNKQIRQDNFYGNPSNELNDERNMLFDELSEYLDINIVHTSQDITGVPVDYVTIELKNTAQEPGASGPKGENVKLVSGSQVNYHLAATETAEGGVKLAVIDPYSKKEASFYGYDGSGKPIGDVTQKLLKGTVKGYIDIINGKGPPAGGGESTYKGIPYYQKSLDEFAIKLAEIFNRVNNVTKEEARKANEEGNAPSELQATMDKNLFVPILFEYTNRTSGAGDLPNEEADDWIASIKAGSRQFSGRDYPISFTQGLNTKNEPVIKAEIVESDGSKTVYEAAYDAANPSLDLKFYARSRLDADGNAVPFNEEDKDSLAFTVKVTGAAYQDASISLNGNVTAKNIAISSSWLDDPGYMTTTKLNAVTEKKPELMLSGTGNPSWLKTVSYAAYNAGDITDSGQGFNVPNGAYKFLYDKASKELQVQIAGVTYKGTYAPNSTINLTTTGDENGKIGLVITTNSTAADKLLSESVANIRNITGAAADNIIKLKTEITGANYYDNSGFTGNFQEMLVGFQSEMALDQSENTTMLLTSTQVITDYADRRDAVSAVSMDEEGADMMTYQSHYNAAARYMTVLDEALDKIINGMGTVGR